MRIFSTFLLAIAMLLIAGCGTPTPYIKANQSNMHGYYDEKPIVLIDGRLKFNLSVRTTTATPAATIIEHWQRRAAELCGGPAGGTADQLTEWYKTFQKNMPPTWSEKNGSEQPAIHMMTIQKEEVYVGSEMRDVPIFSSTGQLRGSQVRRVDLFETVKVLKGYVTCPRK